MTATLPPQTPDEARGLSRRSFLSRSALGAGVVLTGGVSGLFGSNAVAAGGPGNGQRAIGYGPLVPDPAGRLSLPEGFSYTVVAQAGVTTLESGHGSPGDPDGAACFVRRGGSGSVLVLNHEIGGSEPNPVPKLPRLVYDERAHGGCTNLEVDGGGGRVRQYVSIAGTHNNCAGGRTPWDTWLTCEETEAVLGEPHGYVFDVDPYDREANLDPVPIKALGRFAHEACAVDPNEGVIYMSEDAGSPNGLLLRWVPPSSALPLGKGTLKGLSPTAGQLEALVARTSSGTVVQDLSIATEVGTTYRATWAAVPDRDATSLQIRRQFPNSQITRSRKFEGMWWGDGGAHVVASFARTSDGSAKPHDGQVWFVDPLRETIELKLIFAYTPADQDTDPDGPDNITVSPYGGLILAEDGDGRSHLVGSTEGGETFFFARNEHPDDSELCGPVFSNNRRILFASIQSPGTTFAIQGPFAKQR